MSNNIGQLAKELLGLTQVDTLKFNFFIEKIAMIEREECLRLARYHSMADGTPEEQKAFRYAQRCIVNSINSRNI